MSTEDTQTDVGASGGIVESNDTQVSQETTSPESSTHEPINSMDGLKSVAKNFGKKGQLADGTAAGETADPLEAKPDSELTPQELVEKYEPNYKYKAALQEKEIEEFWRPLIKDADSEKRVKEALQKLDGFDFVKDSRDKIEGQLGSLNQDYQAQAEIVNRVESAISRGDLTSVFRQLGVTKEQAFQWTHEQLQIAEMPPEQRKAYEDAESLRVENNGMQEQMTNLQSMYEHQAVQTRAMQLDQVLSRPEIADTATRWDQVQGPGSFKDLVIREAQLAFAVGKQDLSAEQAAQLVMQKFGRVLTSGGDQQAVMPQAPASLSQTPNVQAPQSRPVIPNINGKGAAPIKKAPRSIDDLKKLAKEMQSQNV